MLVSADYSQIELRVMAWLLSQGIYMESPRRTKKRAKAKPFNAVPLQACAPEGYVVGGHNPVTIEAQIVDVRPLAIKVVQPDMMDYLCYAWMPRSLIIAPTKSGHFTSRDKLVKIVIPRWLALDKGLHYAEGNTYVLDEPKTLDERLEKIAREMKAKGLTIDREALKKQRLCEFDTETTKVPPPLIYGEAPGQLEKKDDDGYRCPMCGAFWSKNCPECERRLALMPKPIDDERERLLAIRDMERDQPSACAKLPLKPRSTFTVDVTDEDLLCMDTRER